MRRFHLAARIFTWILLAHAYVVPAIEAHPQDTNVPAMDRPPNIIVIMADDLGWGEVGAYGQQKIRTPNIDRLAREGMRFTHAYAGAPVCAPSRSVLMSGMHTGRTPVRDNREIGTWESFRGQFPLPDEVTTLAETLRQRGYATGAFGKWGLGEVGSTGDPLNQGFDRFFGYNCQRHAHNYYPRYLIRDRQRVALEGNDRGQTGAQYAPRLIADELLAFIDEHHEEPFFVYYPSIIPHLALQVPDADLEPYLGTWDDPPYEGGRGYLPHDHPRAAYAAMVSFLDAQVGRILDRLELHGLDNDTIVIFTSDNGPTHGGVGGSDSAFFESNGPFRGLKGSVYEGGLRVPFIVRWPGRTPRGAQSDFVTASQDVLPTLAALIGARKPTEATGISILPTLLERGDQPTRPWLYWEFHGYGGQQAVRLGTWKAVRRDLRKGNREIELYDLAVDPDESENIAALHPEIVERMIAIMREAHIPSDAFPLPVIDNDQ